MSFFLFLTIRATEKYFPVGPKSRLFLFFFFEMFWNYNFGNVLEKLSERNPKNNLIFADEIFWLQTKKSNFLLKNATFCRKNVEKSKTFNWKFWQILCVKNQTYGACPKHTQSFKIHIRTTPFPV